MKKILSVLLVLGLLLNSALAGNVPTIQSKDYDQKQRVINLYEQIHEFLLYQYTIANNQNKIIIKKILNLPTNKLIIKAFPYENKISFFDKEKENFISFNNQKEFIQQLNELTGQNTKIGPIITAILIGVTIEVLSDIAIRIEHWGEKECIKEGGKIICKIQEHGKKGQ